MDIKKWSSGLLRIPDPTPSVSFPRKAIVNSQSTKSVPLSQSPDLLMRIHDGTFDSWVVQAMVGVHGR